MFQRRRLHTQPHPVLDTRSWTKTWFQRVMGRSSLSSEEEQRYTNMFDSINLDLESSRPRPRVAYLVSGHFRNFENLKHLWIEFRKSHPNFDVYVHTWDDLGSRSQTSWIDTSTRGQLQIEEIKDAIRPSAILVQPMDAFDFSALRKLRDDEGNAIDLYYTWFEELERMTLDGRTTDFPSCILSQLYSVQAAWKLMHKSGKDYDVVVRMRADCMPAVPTACVWMPFCEARLFDNVLFFNGSNKHVHCKGGRGCLTCDSEANGYRPDQIPNIRFRDKVKLHSTHDNDVCDIFYYGNQAAMSRICNLYDRVPDLVKEFHEYNKTALRDPKVSQHVVYLPNINLYAVKNSHTYEDHVKCFYPERLIREHLKDMWLLSDPCKVEPWK